MRKGALRTPPSGGARALTRNNSASQWGVTVRARPGAGRRGTAASPLARKRLRTGKTIASRRRMKRALCGAVSPWVARRTLC
jgi:hypothetical protein